ncbi:primary-amine oxidase [Rummeliibacillus suwonensis]|uniref:primary-amine oxidase n=1 Tax=Rummeliibacillus suwonensis TaxID=1306154 RepID=UPI001AAE91DF|nr:primary-amine oxidase [Rummeliibacillus suwonensis]MBO2535899.1 primary-amine oxidase [Rummeliibacillus suwonensis]
MVTINNERFVVDHPLSPLTEGEVKLAVEIIRKEKELSQNVRFAMITLQEPDKEVVLNYKKGDPISREIAMILLDTKANKTFEAIVSVTESKVVTYEKIPDVQPNFMLDEFSECENIVKNNSEFKEALKRRGIMNSDLIMVDLWSAGYFNIPEHDGKRIARAICWEKKFENDNGYAYPLTGIVAYVDLNKMEVERIEDHGVRETPTYTGNYYPETNEAIKFRDDLKPLEIIQSEGPSFTVEGNLIKWQKWSFRYGFTPREGLVLYTIGYEDKGKVRPILYRAALSEMVVPYGDSSFAHNTQNAFDAGEYGMGQLANSLELGCDCLGEIQYFDAVLGDNNGHPRTIKNAICLHEEDYGIGWKHTDWRTDHVEVRRSRRLVISFFCTVGNYDYGFYWSFYLDGTIEVEVKLTGMLNTGTFDETGKSKYGNEIAPGLNAVNHQHFFNFRLDTSLDGIKNSVIETETVSEPEGPNNPHSNAYYPVSRTFKNEQEAVRILDMPSQRSWKIVNKNSLNFVNQPVGYKIMPGENCLPYAHDSASVIKRAGFIKNHLYVTRYNPEEMYATGKYPNQNKGGDGLPKYVQANRSIDDEDIVVWYTMGHHHITRPEDWPVMPTAYINFQLKPVGFFDGNPALDVPRPIKKSSCSTHGISHCKH